MNIIIDLVKGTATLVTTAADQALLAKATREAVGAGTMTAQPSR